MSKLYSKVQIQPSPLRNLVCLNECVIGFGSPVSGGIPASSQELLPRITLIFADCKRKIRIIRVTCAELVEASAATILLFPLKAVEPRFLSHRVTKNMRLKAFPQRFQCALSAAYARG